MREAVLGEKKRKLKTKIVKKINWHKLGVKKQLILVERPRHVSFDAINGSIVYVLRTLIYHF